MSNFEDFMIGETVQANSQIRALMAERDSLKVQLEAILNLPELDELRIFSREAADAVCATRELLKVKPAAPAAPTGEKE